MRNRLTECKGCGGEISTSAKTCPKCGHPTRHISLVNIAILVAVLLIALYALATMEIAPHGIESQVASDALEQYNIAAAQGDPIQKCVEAGIVAAAYLQAEDQANYEQWKDTQAVDCQKAGVPQ
jgi:uncharacterized paraquat-inducible protein A